tara:strand:+ start:892 stop:1494 length:603 start_codon:yes stop_codon:yes gene_type:complete
MLPLASFSQMSSNPYVKLVEKQTGKRLQLFAENTDSIPYMVFLRVTTADYRRTSKRPILKEIPGHSRLLLKTLIVLNGKEGHYDATFIVNEVTNNIAIRKSKALDIKISDAQLQKTVLIFTNSNCDLCDEIIEILAENAFNYEDYNLETNTEASEVLTIELKDSASIEEIMFPVLKIEDTVYMTIKTRQEFIDILKLHFD